MKTLYQAGPATARVVPMLGELWVFDVHCPRAERRQGHATRVMEAIVRDADHEAITLYLSPDPDASPMMGGIGARELPGWYERFGFRWVRPPVGARPGHMRRLPTCLE